MGKEYLKSQNKWKHYYCFLVNIIYMYFFADYFQDSRFKNIIRIRFIHFFCVSLYCNIGFRMNHSTRHNIMIKIHGGALEFMSSINYFTLCSDLNAMLLWEVWFYGLTLANAFVLLRERWSAWFNGMFRQVLLTNEGKLHTYSKITTHIRRSQRMS